MALRYSSRRLTRRISALSYVGFIALCVPATHAQTVVGADTRGGAVPGATIARVTNLEDNGPGSLRAALALPSPTIVIFDVGGTIPLKSDLKISRPFTTIAGQSAPSPGITLMGGALRIHSHDIIVEHISVRPGPGKTAKENDNRDAISIDGNPAAGGNSFSFNVLLENVSASWSVDEALSLWYESTRNVTIRNSIIAEALRSAGHPKGDHSMGLLIGPGISGVEISGNLLASNVFRNPAISQGATVYFANNYVYNPGQNGAQFYDRENDTDTVASFVNNVYESGRDTKKAIFGIAVSALGTPGAHTTAYISGNIMNLGDYARAVAANPATLIANNPPLVGRWTSLIRADEVKAAAFRYAGSRPADRNAVDRAIIDDVQRGQERVVDMPPMERAIEKTSYATAEVPSDPFAVVSDGQYRIEQWLCTLHRKVGGQASPRCK